MPALVLLLVLFVSSARSAQIYIPPLLVAQHTGIDFQLANLTHAALKCAESLASSTNDEPSTPTRPCHEGLTATVTKMCISRIIHQTWKTAVVPEMFTLYVSSWKKYNPNWLHIVWDDDSLLQLVDFAFPQLSALYRAYPYPVMRADAARILLVYYYGGVYADMDYELTGPIEDIIRLSRPIAYLGHSGGASPAFFMGRPRNPFHAYMIEQLPATFRKHMHGLWKHQMIIDTNGPNFVRDSYQARPGQLCYLPYHLYAPCDECGNCQGRVHLGYHHHSSVWHASTRISSTISHIWGCHCRDLVATVSVLLVLIIVLYHLRKRFRTR